MQLDWDQVMILLQRRYNVLCEISRLTDELQDAVSREDNISVALLLQMRGEEMRKHESCRESILLLAERGAEEARIIRELVLSDSFAAPPSGTFEERKIYDIRQRTRKLIGDIREKDRRFNQRVGGNRSYYNKTIK